MTGYRVTIDQPGVRPSDGRFYSARRDSRGRYYREYHYKSDALTAQTEIRVRSGFECHLTRKGQEP